MSAAVSPFSLPVGAHPSQAGGLVSLWWAPLDVPASAMRRLTACLSSEERQRAERFYRPIDRQRFLACRGWLRHLLGDQLLSTPDEVEIATGDHGKPRLAGSDLRFSSTRSADIAVYATSWETEVGIDVEAVRESVDVDGIAARFFSPAERRGLAALPPGQRLAASFQCWTCKEAYVKGIGAGLSFPLGSVDVWVDGGQPAKVPGWSVHQIAVAPGFAAAVAGEDLGGWVPSGPRQLGGPNCGLVASRHRR